MGRRPSSNGTDGRRGSEGHGHGDPDAVGGSVSLLVSEVDWKDCRDSEEAGADPRQDLLCHLLPACFWLDGLLLRQGKSGLCILRYLDAGGDGSVLPRLFDQIAFAEPVWDGAGARSGTDVKTQGKGTL